MSPRPQTKYYRSEKALPATKRLDICVADDESLNREPVETSKDSKKHCYEKDVIKPEFTFVDVQDIDIDESSVVAGEQVDPLLTKEESLKTFHEFLAQFKTPGSTPILCNICGKFGLKAENKFKKKPSVGLQVLRTCIYCGKFFKNKQSFDNHIQRTHIWRL